MALYCMAHVLAQPAQNLARRGDSDRRSTGKVIDELVELWAFAAHWTGLSLQ
jgi:hypothetical protein